MDWWEDNNKEDLITFVANMKGRFFFKIKPNFFYIGYKDVDGVAPEKIFSGTSTSIDAAKEEVQEAFDEYLREN